MSALVGNTPPAGSTPAGSLGELVGSGGRRVLASFREAQAFSEKTLAGRPVLYSLPSSTD